MIYLIYIGTFILFINSILYGKIKGENSPFIFLKVYLLLMLLIQVSSVLLSELKVDNLFLSHFYFIFQFVLLSLFYVKLFETKQMKRMIKLVLLLVLSVLCVQYIVQRVVFFEFNLLEIALTSVSLIIYSIIYLYESLVKRKEYSYINYGVFMYLLSSTLLFCSGNIMKELGNSVNKIIWFVNSVLFVCYQLLIFYEWYKNIRHNKVLEIN